MCRRNGWRRQINRTQHYDYVGVLVFQARVISEDAHNAGDSEQQKIGDGSKQNKRPASFEVLRMRARLDQVGKHLNSPLAGACGSRELVLGRLDSGVGAQVPGWRATVQSPMSKVQRLFCDRTTLLQTR